MQPGCILLVRNRENTPGRGVRLPPSCTAYGRGRGTSSAIACRGANKECNRILGPIEHQTWRCINQLRHGCTCASATGVVKAPDSSLLMLLARCCNASAYHVHMMSTVTSLRHITTALATTRFCSVHLDLAAFELQREPRW